MRRVSFGVLFILAAASVAAQEQRIAYRPLPFAVKTLDGTVLEAEAGVLSVPENRARPEARSIKLTFARLKSTSKKPGHPLVYLHGGPGFGATGAVRNAHTMSMWKPFLAFGDVIILDQRGCGRSEPDLSIRPTRPLPADFFLSRSKMMSGLVDVSREARDNFARQGIDLSAYTTEENADDIDDLRRALGADKLNLVGFSYGTHLGLSVIRRHGEHLASVALIGTEGPDHTFKLPTTYDTQLMKLSRMVAADPVVGAKMPDLFATFRRVLEKLRNKPAIVKLRDPVSKGMIDAPIGPDGLRWLLRLDIGDTIDLPVFPRLLHHVDRGNYRELAWFAQKRLNMFTNITSLIFTMDPASGASPSRARRIAAEARTSLFGNAMNFDDEALDAVWQAPDLGPGFRAPIVSDVRTLFLSGDLDCNTPPYQAEEVRWGFSRSTHLVQRNGGHEAWFRNEKAHAALRRFFAGEDVANTDVDLPPLRFVALDGPPGAVSHPSVR